MTQELGSVWPPPPPPGPPSPPPSPPSPPTAGDRGPTGATGRWFAGAVAIAAVVVAAALIGLAVSGHDTTTPVTSSTTLPRPDPTDRTDLAALMPPAPTGFVVAPVQVGSLTADAIIATAGRAKREIASALRTDGFVTGWQRGYVSVSGRGEIQVSLYRMASTAGASAFSARSVRPWLLRRGWSFAPAPAGVGAVALQRSIPDAAGTYGYVLAQPVARVVLVIETRSPFPQAMYGVMADLVNVERSRVDH